MTRVKHQWDHSCKALRMMPSTWEHSIQGSCDNEALSPCGTPKTCQPRSLSLKCRTPPWKGAVPSPLTSSGSHTPLPLPHITDLAATQWGAKPRQTSVSRSVKWACCSPHYRCSGQLNGLFHLWGAWHTSDSWESVATLFSPWPAAAQLHGSPQVFLPTFYHENFQTHRKIARILQECTLFTT